MKRKIEDLIRIYKKMLEKENKIIEATVGKVDDYSKWFEAVNASSCYQIFIKDLEELLKEAEREEDDRK